MLSPSLVIFAALSLSSLSGSTDVPRFEFLNLPKQKCGTPLCGDYWQTGRCTVKRLNGCQDQYCRAHGGCGIECLCEPVPGYGIARAAAGPPFQFVFDMCPEEYGLPMQKCYEPKCGGEASNNPGFCKNAIGSGARPVGCDAPNCGVITCACDNSPGPIPSQSTPVANTSWISGTVTLPSTWESIGSVSNTLTTLTSSSIMPSSAGSSNTLFGIPTSSTSWKSLSASLRASITASSIMSSTSPDIDLVTQPTGPIWEPTALPGPVTSGGMIIPIIPIIPIVPPPPGFVMPPPGIPEPTKSCPADYQDTKCGDCVGEYGWCSQPPSQGCPCQDACTTGDNMPDCNDAQCEGQDSKCTIGPQKDCECKSGCPEGVDDKPICGDNECEGASEAQCTTGQYAGCDCFASGETIAEEGDYTWAVIQQGVLNLMAIHAPNGAYSSLLGMTSSISTFSSMSSMPTRTSNSSLSTTSSVATTTSPQTCWTVRSQTICIKSEATVVDGHTTTEILNTTLTLGPSLPGTTKSSDPGHHSTSLSTPLDSQPSGPMYGIYIALWSSTDEIPQPNGLPPEPYYEYNDLIWVSSVRPAAFDILTIGPQYCVTDSVDSTITISTTPTFNQAHPFPISPVTSLKPAGTSGPSCDWIPALNNDAPGSLSCDAAPTSVGCEIPSQPATTCPSGDLDVAIEVYPVVQCIWQGD